MNGCKLTRVYRINSKLVVGDDVEDAIKVFRDWSSPCNVTIETVELVFGGETDSYALMAAEDRKAAEAIALLTEENEELRKKLR